LNRRTDDRSGCIVVRNGAQRVSSEGIEVERQVIVEQAIAHAENRVGGIERIQGHSDTRSNANVLREPLIFHAGTVVER